MIAPKIARRLEVPTEAEIDAHYPVHAMEGKGVSRHHEKGKEEDASGSMIRVEECLWAPEESEEEMDAILVGYDSEELGLRTMAVYAKGPTPSSTERLGIKIEEAGYNGVSITLKSDQEESIKALKKAVSMSA